MICVNVGVLWRRVVEEFLVQGQTGYQSDFFPFHSSHRGKGVGSEMCAMTKETE